MERDTAVSLALALLALLAIGAAGATLQSPAAPEGSGPGSGGGQSSQPVPPSSGSGNGSTGGQAAPSSSSDRYQAACAEPLMSLSARLAIAGAVVVAALLAWRWSDQWFIGAFVFFFWGTVAFAMWFALAGCDRQQPSTQSSNASSAAVPNATSGGGGGLGGAADSVTSQPPLLLALVLVVFVALVLVALYLFSGDDESVAADAAEDDADEGTEAPDVAAIGRVAGEAADRIDAEADAENEVFRAWASMTDHLPVEHPESSTPAEFADAAVDAGMAPDDVRELTGLFEAVRYGGREATAEREERAVAALRRIEEGYADADLPEGAGADDADGGER